MHYRRYFKGTLKASIDDKTIHIINVDECNSILKEYDVIYQVDGKDFSDDTIILAIGNGTYYGGTGGTIETIIAAYVLNEDGTIEFRRFLVSVVG